MVTANGMKAQSKYGSEEELKEAALQFFEDKNFEEALPLYSQLLSLYPKDANYNYRYGSSLLMAGSDREKALNYIQYAISKGGIEAKAYFYLGKAHHLNYDFSNAIKFYNRFQNLASSSIINEYDVDHQIEMCTNGKNLLKKVNGIQVMSKQEISSDDFFRIYKMEGLKGKLLAKPEEFMSKYDSKINEKSIMFLPDNSDEVYYSSYGKDGKKGRDIYKKVKLSNGSWSEAINMGDHINTPYDENYVYVHPDGQTMFFASNGHNSMGGYDLFQSIYDASTAQWSIPENLDFPFSTVDNDLLFIPNENKQLAYFASDRNSPSNRLTVYKAGTDKVPAQLTIIKGKFIAKDMPHLKKAKITVLDVKNQRLGVFETDEKGNYEIAIHKSGGNYRFNVETTSSAPIHSGQVVIPKPNEMEIYSQELHLVGTEENQSLVIKNNFEDPQLSSDENIVLSPEILKKQANIEVNVSGEEELTMQNEEESSENRNTSPTDELKVKTELDHTESTTSNNTVETSSTNSQRVSSDEELVEDYSTNVESAEEDSQNEETVSLENNAFGVDSEELNKEFDQLSVDVIENVNEVGSQAEFAYYLASVKSTQALEKFQEAEKLEQLDKSIDALEKEKLNNLKEEGGILAAQAVFASQLARLLEKENTEGKELVDKLNKTESKPTSKKSLDSLKSSLDDLEQSSINISKEIIEEESIKLKDEIKVLQDKNNELKLKQNKIESNITALESEKAKTSKKKLPEIELRITDLRFEKEDTDFEIDQNLGKIEGLQESIMEANAELLFLNEFDKLKDNRPEEVFSLEQKHKKDLMEQLKKYRLTDQFTYSNHQSIPLDQNLPTKENLLAQQESLNENIRQSNPENTTNRNIEIENSEFTEATTANPSSNTNVESVPSVSASSEDDFSNFKYENTFEYNLPDAGNYKEEAETYKKNARELEQKYRSSLEEVKNLPSEDERTAKIQKLNELKLKSQAAQLSAAEAYAKANRLEYLRNSAILNSVVENESDNSQIALMLSDEAELYYGYAKTIRDRTLEEDRFGKKEVDFQKAYDYEMKALKKQSEALKLMESSAKDASNDVVDENQINNINMPIEAKTLADEQMKKSSELLLQADKLEDESNNSADPQTKNSLLEEASQLRSTAQKYMETANVLYLKEMQLNSSTYVPMSSKSSKKALAPVQVKNSVLDADSSTLEIDEAARNQTSTLPIYRSFYESYSERENLIKEAEVEYSKASKMSEEQLSLKEKENSLRIKASETEDVDEKIRLIKEATVINQKSNRINASIDSLNHIIKVKNYLIQQKDNTIQKSIATMDEGTAERVVKLAQVEYMEKKLPSKSDEQIAVIENDSENVIEEQLPKVTEDIQSEKGNTREETIKDREDEREELISDQPNQSSDQVQPNEGFDQINFIPEKIKSDIFIVKPNRTAVYSNSNPIPIEPKMPGGLIYQVQVGAFRNPISQDLFKGFAPLMGEKTASGITRYTAGFFKDFTSGDSAKVEIRKLGYADAFVVAFMDGKRISVSEARKISGEDKLFIGTTGTSNSQIEVRTDKFGNVYANGDNTLESSAKNVQTDLPSAFLDEEVEEVQNAKEIKGLYYSVQIGVFSKPVKKGVFDNYGILLVDVLDNGLLRYHVGNFKDISSALELKERISADQVSDAFVVAYNNGTRISISQAKNQ